MTHFRIHGTATVCSREFIRAWLHASRCVLAYHNRVLPHRITVRLLPEGAEPLGHNQGMWCPDEWPHEILLSRTLGAEDMATTILHEVIHGACGDFGDGTNEKCCSTLTARLKPEVHTLAHLLLEGTYRRAAYLAHTKLSYVVDEDHYDKDEDRPVGVTDRYKKNA